MKITTLVASVIATMLGSSATAQMEQSPTGNIDAIVNSILYSRENGFANDKSVTGAAIGVYWKGKTYYYSFGWADKERQVKPDTNTLFEIGSNSKVFTGLMLSSGIAEKKISAHDFIDKYVPVNRGIQNRVRITDLANHTSGLPTFHDSSSLAELIAKDTTKDPLMIVTDAYMLSVLKKTDTLHNYGSYEYSNFAVGILGYILQQTERKTYEQLLQKMICEPMQLKHTTTIADTNSRRVAKGYYHGQRAPFINLCTALQGAGAIKSNIVDMMRFVRYQISGHKYLQPALDISQKKYYNGEDLQVAMGWHVGKMYGAEMYEMRGDTYGASSTMLFSKEHELGIVILLNSANSRAVSSIRNAILAKLLDTTGSQNRFTQPEVTVDKSILETYVGKYELEPGFDATISVEAEKLAIQLTGQPKLIFKAVAPNWFVLEKFNCQLEFLGDGSGVCKEFILHQDSERISCKRKS